MTIKVKMPFAIATKILAPRPRLLRYLAILIPMALAACSSAPPRSDSAAAQVRSTNSKPLPVLPPAGSGRGGYYKDDGPGDHPPEGLLDLPDAEPRIEPYSKAASRPYVVFGKTYTPLTDDRPFKERGIGSWYGKKFHGAKTSSGEPYDMYKMTAAHPTLPIPSYARVTNLKTGAQVIVRINDRGPFHTTRIIDLSYTAALKLGYLSSGSSELEVERLLPDDIRQIAENKRNGIPAVATTAVAAGDDAVTVGAVAPPGQLIQAPLNTSAVILSSAASGASNTAASGAGTTDAAALPSGFYLQLGAYSQQNNAYAARDQLMGNLVGAINKLDTVIVNGMYRLMAGPYANRPAAMSAAEMVRLRSNVTPFIVER